MSQDTLPDIEAHTTRPQPPVDRPPTEQSPDAPSENRDPLRDIAAHCRRFKGADTKRGVAQLTITAVLFAALFGGMLTAHALSLWWLLPLLALPASGLLVRLFIIQHDCGHGSYFSSRTANDIVGRVISLLTATPYDPWKRAHNIHHASSGNLDHRGAGAIDTLTVREYRALPWRKRFTYRLYRNPFVLLLIGTPAQLLLVQRLPLATMAPFFESHTAVPFRQVWRSILLLDTAMAVFYGLIAWALGWHALLTVCLPVLVLTSWIGGWLFYIQHQFEHTYWQPGQEWDFKQAALGGSSYYVLPRFLHWFTGNIGLHHIHHLCSAIPNYRLQECLRKSEALQQINRMTFWQSLKCLGWSLWDEDRQRMVGFRHLRRT